MVRTSGRRVGWALVALLALGCWPWIGSLGLWPMAPDSGLWIERGATFSPEWTQWVFGTRHFHVGYRPITALTYTLDWIVGGTNPVVYRGTDLALHLAAAVGVHAVFRRIFPQASPWAALLAAGLFLAHPAVEDTVPYIARRSYALSTALALAALTVWLAGDPTESRPASLRHITAGTLMALALLSNEVAILPAAALPLLAWARSDPRPGRARRVFMRLLPAGLLLLAALLVRTWVVGGIGGYETTAQDPERTLPVMAAAWRAAAGLPTPVAEGSFPIHWVLLAIAAPYYLVQCVRGAAGRGILGLWIVATTVLFGLQDVWFPRQGYALATPVALLAAHVLSETLRSRRGPALRLLALAPQLLLIGTLLAGSAMVLGPDARRMREWRLRDALIDDMVADIGSLEGPVDVHTVVPFRRGDESAARLKGAVARRPLPRSARQPVTWVRLLLRDHDLRLQEFAYVLREDLEALGAPTFDATAEPPVIVLPAERAYLLRRGARWLPFDAAAERRLPVDPPNRTADRTTHVYLAGVSGGELFTLEP